MGPQCNVSLDECYELVEEMKKMYAGEEDKDAVLSLRMWHEKIYGAFDMREEHMAKLIREMTGRTQEAEKKATPPEPPEAHQRRVDDLDAEKSAYVDEIEKCTTEAEKLEGEAEALQSKAAAVRFKRQQLDEAVAEEVPRLRQQLGLYAGITRIGWTYECKDRVRGRVTDPSAGDVRPFDFDPKAMTDVQLADALWELV